MTLENISENGNDKDKMNVDRGLCKEVQFDWVYRITADGETPPASITGHLKKCKECSEKLALQTQWKEILKEYHAQWYGLPKETLQKIHADVNKILEKLPKYEK